MEYLEKIPAIIFAIVVLFLALKAIRNALKFTDAGIFNFIAIAIFVVITVPPCRPYTEKAFKWGWDRLPAAATQKEATFHLIEDKILKPLSRGGSKLEGSKGNQKDFIGQLIVGAFTMACMLIAWVIIVALLCLYGIYHHVLLKGCFLLWRLYLFPPVLGFFAYDIATWAANAPIIGIPAAYLFAPFDAVFSGIRRKKMDIELVKLRGDIVNKVNAIDRTQNSPIAINTAELRGALNSSTLLTKWFRGWKGRVSSSMDQKALDSLTQTMNAYITLLDSYDRLGMQQHKMKLTEARQELFERDLVAQAEQIEAERKKAIKEQAVAELTTLEAKAEKEKLETQLEKLKKKYNV